MTTMGASVPTLEEAQLAADALLAAEPAAEVSLYGSVARGEANEESDIDLLVVFPDIDYRNQWKVKKRLESIVRETLGDRPFNLHLTDLPEWVMRSKLPFVFEYQISKDLVHLGGKADRDAVRWGKPQSKPADSVGQAAVYLRLGDYKLDKAEHCASMFEWELEQCGDDKERIARSKRSCLLEVVGNCASATEAFLKAAVILQGHYPPPGRKSSDRINLALNEIDEPLRGELKSLIRGHGLTEAEVHRLTAFCCEHCEPDEEVDALFTETSKRWDKYTATACSVARRVAAEYESYAETPSPPGQGSPYVEKTVEELEKAMKCFAQAEPPKGLRRLWTRWKKR